MNGKEIPSGRRSASKSFRDEEPSERAVNVKFIFWYYSRVIRQQVPNVWHWKAGVPVFCSWRCISVELDDDKVKDSGYLFQ
jgi:hypothetical protein